ncbi:MAG: hydroxymethylpyrimidine/phosphomethylpyrimidine kinase [Halobacteriota archaeon]
MQSILSIAGLDTSCGAGICADVKTAKALSFHACTAITAITFQNTCEVQGMEPVDKKVLTEQLDAITGDIPISAIKIGLVPDKETAEIIGRTLKKLNVPTVLDPVIRSTTGFDIGSLEGYRLLIPSCSVITPNAHEMRQLTGITVSSVETAKEAAASLPEGISVVITGINGRDLIFDPFNGNFHIIGKELEMGKVHGTGCVYSTSLACHLVSRSDLFTACKKSRRLTIAAARRANTIGKCLPVVNP